MRKTYNFNIDEINLHTKDFQYILFQIAIKTDER